MPSYVVVGASRGIGYEFIRTLSANPSNTVVGLVRNVQATQEKVKADVGSRSNLHILHGDLDSYESLKKAADDTAKITAGALDYLVANAARISYTSGLMGFSGLTDPVALEEELMSGTKSNIVGLVHTFNVFLPLIRKGQQKKVTFITSGHAELDLVNKHGVYMAGPYAIDKAGGNMVVAKYGAEYKDEGILFLSISPGMVDTGNLDPSSLSEVQMKGFQDMVGKFREYAPHFTAPLTTEQSVKMVLEVIESKSVAGGGSGVCFLHLGIISFSVVREAWATL